MQLIQYNSSALFVGPSQAVGTHGPTNILPLYGVQSASFDFGEPLTDIEGTEGVFERVRSNPNEVNLNFGYILRDGSNEEKMGILVDGTGAAFANLWSNERNYFVAMRNDKTDILLYSGYDTTVIAFGQGCLTSYGINAAVGQPLQANASLSFLNVGVALSGLDAQLPVVHKQDGTTVVSYGFDNFFFTGSGTSSGSDFSGDTECFLFSGSGTNPAGDISVYCLSGSGATTDWGSLDTLYTMPAYSFNNVSPYAIGPGDMILKIPEGASFSTIVSGVDECIVQSFDLTVALVRQSDHPLGWVYPRQRLVDPPIEAKLSVNAFVIKDKAGLLNERVCNNSGQSIELAVTPRCLADGSGIGGSDETMRFRLDGARLDSTSMNLGIGDYQRVTFNWSVRIFHQNATGVNFGNLTITAD